MYIVIFLIIMFIVFYLFRLHSLKAKLDDPIYVAASLVIYVIEQDIEIEVKYRYFILEQFLIFLNLSTKDLKEVYSASYVLIKKRNAYESYAEKIKATVQSLTFEQRKSLDKLFVRCSIFNEALTETQTERLNAVRLLLTQCVEPSQKILEQPEWCQNTKLLDGLKAEIVFLFKQELSTQGATTSINLPNFPRIVEEQATTEEALLNIDGLYDYYRQVGDVTEQANLAFYEVSYFYWMRLWLWHPDEEESISFPWYDTLASMMFFISWLRFGFELENFIDHRQGWSLEAHVSNGMVFIRQLDDEREELTNISTPYINLLQSINEVEQRVQRIAYLLFQKGESTPFYYWNGD